MEVNNKQNLSRRNKKLVSHFWDDSGAWDSTGATNKTLYLLQPDCNLMKVVLKESKYCLQRRKDTAIARSHLHSSQILHAPHFGQEL